MASNHWIHPSQAHSIRSCRFPYSAFDNGFTVMVWTRIFDITRDYVHLISLSSHSCFPLSLLLQTLLSQQSKNDFEDWTQVIARHADVVVELAGIVSYFEMCNLRCRRTCDQCRHGVHGIWSAECRHMDTHCCDCL
jgi:hypothetical protein